MTKVARESGDVGEDRIGAASAIDRHDIADSRSREGHHDAGLLVTAASIVVLRYAAEVISLRETQAFVRQGEDRFRQMAELTPQFIWVSRPDGSLEYVNRRWTEYSGFDLAATADFDRLAAAIHPDECATMFGRWAQSVATGQPFELEARLRRRDGAWRWFVVRTAPMRAADGTIVRWFGVSTDIHERKLAEAALRASDEQLREAHAKLEDRVRQRTEELNRAKGALETKLREERMAQSRIAGLLKQLVTIQEEERHRVARELHDQLGQPMTALRMHLEAWQLQGRDPESAEQVASATRLAEELDRRIDYLTWQMRPSVIDDLGISDALADLVSNWSQQFHIAAEYESNGVDNLRLPSDIETHLYRIAQEALHNVYKHARASHVVVRLGQRNGQLVMSVADDGCGLEASAKDVFAVGMGLSNMRDRAVLAAGELFVFWSRGGTTIEVRLPQSSV